MRIVIVGGGAAGIFAANTAKLFHPEADVIVLEKSAKLLSKVLVSGGGRCNVTHHCFEPKELVRNYPRGQRELLGPFHCFGPQQTIEWFAERGVQLKAEADGRMFPTTDSSQTVIDCLLSEARRLGVDIRTRQKISTISKGENFVLHLEEEVLECERLILAMGSAPAGHAFAEAFGHRIEAPVPSLFTFNVPGFELVGLAGAATDARLRLAGTKFEQRGPLLITHWGFSGPAAIKLSAWAARALHACDYKAELLIDWLPDRSFAEELQEQRVAHPKKAVQSHSFGIPKKLWKHFVMELGIAEKPFGQLSKRDAQVLETKMHRDSYKVDGKTTHKEEFVTCGGVALNEVNFKTMESKLCPGLYFAGEILDIDGVTGGFNFQNAWTTGFIAGRGHE
ncbi:MAG: NAD(P)/FAD-dependent oxidoreductase [Chlamydiia bacterium]|nr:NAD(P)/FAD-dependent oxidoreductase [Chlamydiia bacterium]